MTTMFKKFATGTAALALMTTVFASGTLAAETGVSSTITGGELTLSDISATSFSGTKLDGKIQNDSTASIQPFTITDARGTGTGWDVSISASALTNPSVQKALSPGTLTIGTPNLTGIDGASIVADLAKLGGVIDNGPVKVLTAETDEGMGTFEVSAIPMTLNLKPSEVYAGTYSTTISVTLTNGPQ
ncbi:WxL domain-containing protein [Planococcus salinus]|uniref:WxL domain-containing protein n=1 Tax=Planococcus salinus TaxID=1848460 RepID=A0A3M8P887_9BACL|nr:WxL domain-containing protein [Planococcus salinus]RNF39480.1 hypothetical protein EEX84_08355 [Planococcus salinus]